MKSEYKTLTKKAIVLAVLSTENVHILKNYLSYNLTNLLIQELMKMEKLDEQEVVQVLTDFVSHFEMENLNEEIIKTINTLCKSEPFVFTSVLTSFAN